MRYWLRYSKTGLLRFVGHLDMLHAWERILRRANVPMAFTQGFSPRPQLSLAAPLPVGLMSSSEYLELRTTKEVDDLIELIKPVLPQDMSIAGVAALPEKTKALMGMLRFAAYTVQPIPSSDQERVCQEVASFLQQESVLKEVKRKRSLKTIDIRPLVRSVSLTQDTLELCLAYGSVANLRVQDFIDYLGLNADQLQVTRQELYIETSEELMTPFQYAASLDLTATDGQS